MRVGVRSKNAACRVCVSALRVVMPGVALMKGTSSMEHGAVLGNLAMYMAYAMVSSGHLPLMMLMLLLAFLAEGQTQQCAIQICDLASQGEGLGHRQFRIPTFQTYKIRPFLLVFLREKAQRSRN